MRIRLWKGFHSPELPGLIERAFRGEALLILCPPGLRDASFLAALPGGPLELLGAWDASERERFGSAPRGGGDPGPLAGAVLGVFTTGTVSGRPRLVLYSRANLEASLSGIRSFFDRERIRAIFCYPQPFHTFGLVLGYVHAFLHQVPLRAVPGPYQRGFHEAWEQAREPGLLTLGTPTHLHDLILRARQGGSGRGPVRPTYSSIVGGARVTVGLWRAQRSELGIECPSTGYGATEASPGITHHPPGREPLEDGEVGFALPNLEVELRPGLGVEFEGPGACLATVQDGRLELPRRILIRDQLERRPGDGMLVYRGRYELILNRGGQKFALEAMEESLRRALGLDSVCVATPDERLGEELGVLARSEAGDAASAPGAALEALRDQVFGHLEREFGARFDPARFAARAELPVNENGKVDRPRSLRELLSSLPDRAAATGRRL